MSATTTSRNDIINISTGTLTVSGALTTGTTGCKITFTAAGTFNLGGALTGSPSLTTFAGSNVNYTGSGSQTIITAAYIGNLGLSGAGTKSMNGACTVSGTLTLADGSLANGSFLTMATGSTISRSAGTVLTAPTFAGLVNIIYTGSSPVTTGGELPLSSLTINNLTTNAGGVIQSQFTETVSTLYSQGFNGSPADWTTEIITDPSSPAPAINYVTTGTYPTTSPSEGAQFVLFNSYTCQSGDQIRLKKNASPISTTGKTNISMAFDWYVDPGYPTSNDYVTVQWSTNGTTWNNSNSYYRYNASAAWITQNCVLPVGAENQATLYVAFLFTSVYGNDCSLDNLIINGSVAELAPTVYTINGNFDLTAGSYTIGADNSLTLNGSLAGNSAIIGSSSSNLSVVGSGATITLPAITNGLNNFTLNRSNGATLNGNLTVNATLTLSDGILTNGSYLTMGNASTISRSGGLLSESPTFANTVNLVYTGSSPIITGFETPVSAGVLNNLTTNTGGVTQGEIHTAPVNILTDAFSNITSWTGNKGTSNNQFAAVASSNAGGTANECRYVYGSNSGTVYTASIYRSVNTTGYTSLNIRWKQFLDNYDAVTYPYTLKVQCATASGGPWTDIYSYSPTNSADIAPEEKVYDHWTSNVGGTFFIRYYISGYTYGIDFWHIDDLVIDGQSTLGSSTVTVNGTLDLSGGTYSIASNTLALNAGISGSNAIVGGVTSNLSVGGTSSNLGLTGITSGLKDFSINRPAGVTLTGDLTVAGVLNLQSANASSTQGTLHMGTNTLTMGASATTVGAGDVTGIVKRSSFVAGIPYTFGNQYSTFTFENVGTMPTDMSMKITIGTAPDWKTDGIKRITSIIRTGGSGSFMAMNVHYLDAELNGNAEENLIGWVCISPFTPGTAFEMSRSNYDLTNNWVGISGFDVSYLPTSFDIQNSTLGVSQIANSTWNGSVSTVWTNPGNWTPYGVPSDNTDVVIPDAGTTPNDPTTIPTLLLGRLTLQSGAVLNATASSTITISGSSGAWSNNGGTFNANSGTVIFTNAAATISGETNFYNVTINPDASVLLGSSSVMRIGGTITNNGVWDTGDLWYSTVEYNGGSQTVLNPNGSTPYYHYLILSGSGTKTMPATALTIHDDFTLSGTASATAAAALLVTGSVTVGAGASLDMASYSHTIAKDMTNSGGTLTASAGSITFNGNILQTITSSAGISLNNLIVSNTSAAVTLGSSTNCSIAGDLTIDADAVFDLAANTLLTLTGSVSNSGTIRTQSTSATPFPSGKSWGGDFEFTGTVAQTIVAGTYTNLKMSGSGGVAGGVNITVDGILNLASSNPSSTKGILDMGTYTLLMGPSATTIGPGDVTGIIRRTTILDDVTYSFGNEFTTINFPNVGTLPTELSMKVSLGAAPAWKPGAIKRIYDFIQTGSSGTQAILYAHYLDSELNGNSESLLVDWVWISPSTTIEYGRSANDAVENWVQISNVNVGFFSSAFGAKELTLSESVLLELTWNGSVSTSWVTAGNWTPTGAPSANTAITIPDATTTSYDATLPVVATCGLMTLESGAILNAADAAVLTINGAEGAWNNLGGIFNPGNSTVVIKNATATISGTTDFHNLTLDTGSDLTLDVDTYVGITGALTNNGNFGRVDKGSTTIDYKGGDQTVVVPNATTNRYHMLVLSGTGTKTLPATALEIVGDLTIGGTATAIGGAALAMDGNLVVGEGSAFNTGNFNHTIAGNFNNNGTFTGATGYGLTMNGDLTQSINGTGTTDFYNLTISNNSAEGVELNNDVTTNNVLTINSGSKLTINPAAKMNVPGTIANSEGTAGLVIKASPTIANGTLVFHNLVGSPVPATVEMYSIAYKDDNATVKYKWQYFGIPLRSLVASPTFDGGYVRRWNEPTSAWIQLNNASTLNSFVGHEITQLTAKTYVFEGDLENGDLASTALAFDGPTYPGQYIFANPYTAAIDITQLTFGAQTEASVYLYNTGSSTDWSDNFGGSSNGTSPGQYTVAPQETAGTGGIPGQIPSMQGFLVKAMSASVDATFAIPYSSVVTKNTDLQRAPAAGKATTSDKVFTRIDVSGSRFSDRMWIFTNPACTRGFDNGWDGYKFLGSALTPQLFAMESVGDLQIDAVEDINETYLGFKAGEDSKYTLSFTHENMGARYTSLFLQDLQDNTVVDITQSGTNYTFMSQSTTDPVKRFKIVSSPGTDIKETDSQLKIFASHQTVFIQNFSSTAGDIMLYDASGQFIQNFNFGADCVTAITLSLPPGAYLIKATTETSKLNRKILIK